MKKPFPDKVYKNILLITKAITVMTNKNAKNI